MSVAIIQKQEELGSFLSPHDLSQILAPGLRKSSIIKSYFVDPDEDRTNRIMENILQISNIFIEFYPDKLITEVTIQFQRLLPEFLEDYGPNKYFTKNHTANHFLALLDFRLSLVGSKLSPNHIERVREMLGMKKGKTFSYFSMKKTQSELLAAGYLQRKRKNLYTPMLKNKVSQIINEVNAVIPNKDLIFDTIQEKAFDLIDERFIPKIDIEDAALVIVSSLLPYYFNDRGYIHAYWIFIKSQYRIDIELLKRKVYRFRTLLKKKNKNNIMGLGIVEDRRKKHGNSSDSYRFL